LLNNFMRLLILTQKINKNDDLLGFMTGWVAEFSKQFESIIVVALSVGLPCEISQGDNFSERKIISQGDYHLPHNVKVLSLGKDSSIIHNSLFVIPKRIIYLIKFYRYIWQYRNEYDCVLVHMNKEYMVLGGFLWQFWGKKTALWYNHKKGNIASSLAGYLAGQIFYTSPFSFFAKWPKAKIMPVGIDLSIFNPDPIVKKTPGSILFLGRISPVKRPDVLIEALGLLKKEGINFKASLIGDAPQRDKRYDKEINQKIKKLNLSNEIEVRNKIPHWQAPLIYNQHEIFVNLTPAGSMDKTIFEAMACGNLVLIANRSLLGEISEALFFEEDNPKDLAEKIKGLLARDDSSKAEIAISLRKFVEEKHSLPLLAKKIINEF